MVTVLQPWQYRHPTVNLVELTEKLNSLHEGTSSHPLVMTRCLSRLQRNREKILGPWSETKHGHQGGHTVGVQIRSRSM
jgi:hypothetical protein